MQFLKAPGIIRRIKNGFLLVLRPRGGLLGFWLDWIFGELFHGIRGFPASGEYHVCFIIAFEGVDEAMAPKRKIIKNGGSGWAWAPNLAKEWMESD